MAYARAEKGRNTLSGLISGAGTGAGIGTAIAPGIGTAIGGGIGAIVGGVSGFFLTDDEKNEVIQAYREGRLDDATVANIEKTIARRYNMISRQQGAAMARRGLTGSTFAARQIKDTANAERMSLAEAITGEVERRQAIGFGLSDQANAQRAQDVAGGLGALFQAYQGYQEGEMAKAEDARFSQLLTHIGKFYENGGTTPTPAAPKISKSQSGAGNVFARHRSRAPNVALKWNVLNKQRGRTITPPKPSWAMGG